MSICTISYRAVGLRLRAYSFCNLSFDGVFHCKCGEFKCDSGDLWRLDSSYIRLAFLLMNYVHVPVDTYSIMLGRVPQLNQF